MTLRPLPKWVKDCCGYLFAALVAPLFGFLWLADAYDRGFGAPVGEWQRWYAWLPTRLGRWSGDSGVVWLEPVERARWGGGYLYRRPGDTSIRAQWEIVDSEEG